VRICRVYTRPEKITQVQRTRISTEDKSGIETNPIHRVGHRRESLIMLRARISSPFQATNIKDPSVALETLIEEQSSCNQACFVMLNRYEALSVGRAMLAYMNVVAA
jgi:hypothetical protein